MRGPMPNRRQMIGRRLLAPACMPSRRVCSSCCGLLLGTAVTLATFTTPTRAGQWEDCQAGNDAKLIAACTAVIDRAERGPEELAKSHLRRGTEQQRRGLVDQAWADFDAAVKLD